MKEDKKLKIYTINIEGTDREHAVAQEVIRACLVGVKAACPRVKEISFNIDDLATGKKYFKI